jgi:hypothetical protein
MLKVRRLIKDLQSLKNLDANVVAVVNGIALSGVVIIVTPSPDYSTGGVDRSEILLHFDNVPMKPLT